MNGFQQRTRHTTAKQFDAKLDALTAALCAEIERMRAETREAIGAERTGRLKLADEQRGYVDGELKGQRWHVDKLERELSARLHAIESLTFLGRLRWLVLGRHP